MSCAEAPSRRQSAFWCLSRGATPSAYLKRKWRADVTDKGTGLGTDGVLAGWKELVAARGDEPWEVTKAKIFAFGCDRTAIGVSPHDWFPAFAPWSFHRGHPLWKILPQRANEVDSLHSPGLAQKIAVGTKDGSWVVWKDYSHCAPDWDDILALGFPGMRDRLLANWKDAPYYHARRIAADATIRLVERLADHARRANESAPSPRLAAEAAALASLCHGAPRTAYEALMFIYLEWVMGENFDGFQVRTLSNLDRILTPYYRADLAAGRTTEVEFRDQLRHFWWQWGSIDNYFGQPVYFGGTKADGTTEYNEVSRILLEVHDELGLPTPKVHIKTGPSTPDWVWRTTLDLARRQRSVTFCGEEPLARAITGLGYTAEQARTCAIWGCYEWGIRDSCNDTIPSYVSALKPVEKLLARARAGTFDAPDYPSFRAAYLQLLEDTAREARELAFETEKWCHEINPSMLFSLSIAYSVKTGRDAYHDGTAHGNNSHLLLVGTGSAVDSLLAVEDIVYKEKKLALKALGATMAANWRTRGASPARSPLQAQVGQQRPRGERARPRHRPPLRAPGEQHPQLARRAVRGGRAQLTPVRRLRQAHGRDAGRPEERRGNVEEPLPRARLGHGGRHRAHQHARRPRPRRPSDGLAARHDVASLHRRRGQGARCDARPRGAVPRERSHAHPVQRVRRSHASRCPSSPAQLREPAGAHLRLERALERPPARAARRLHPPRREHPGVTLAGLHLRDTGPIRPEGCSGSEVE